MIRRPCITPGCSALTSRNGSRCASCEAARQRKRNRRRTWYGPEWRRVAAAAVAAHVARYGWWCPGAPDLDHEPHVSHDLVVDHIQPRSLARGVRVLCRSANSARGNRVRDDAEHDDDPAREGGTGTARNRASKSRDPQLPGSDHVQFEDGTDA
jgi:hypothetical protein